MSEDTKNNENEMIVDLSELSNIQFATAWTPSSNTETTSQKFNKAGGFKKPFKKNFNKEFSDKRTRKNGDFG